MIVEFTYKAYIWGARFQPRSLDIAEKCILIKRKQITNTRPLSLPEYMLDKKLMCIQAYNRTYSSTLLDWTALIPLNCYVTSTLHNCIAYIGKLIDFRAALPHTRGINIVPDDVLSTPAAKASSDSRYMQLFCPCISGNCTGSKNRKC